MYRSNFSKFLAYFIFCIIFGTFVASCSTGTVEPETVVLGTEYFPLEKGRFVDYKVEDIQFTLINPPDTSRYQIRELIADQFTDINGDPAFRLERFRRATSNNPWQLDSVWVVKRSLNRAIVIQSNQPLVKLTFPLEEAKPWDGNVLNGSNKDLYEIQSLGKAFSIDTFDFAKALKVVQNDDSSLVAIDKRSEIYAVDVGLVYKDSTVVTLCTENPSCFNQIESGRKSIQTIIGFGKQ